MQARAPGAPVILVVTHYDQVIQDKAKFPPDYVEQLLLDIGKRWLQGPEPERRGYP